MSAIEDFIKARVFDEGVNQRKFYPTYLMCHLILSDFEVKFYKFNQISFTYHEDVI